MEVSSVVVQETGVPSPGEAPAASLSVAVCTV